MEKSIFEQMGGTYTLGEDGMYYPDLKLPTDEEPRYGKYGRIRKTFLQKHRHGLYWELLLNGRLVKHLNELDAEAHEQVEFLIRQMAKKQGITEDLKAHNQMAWVGKMNNIKNAAEEIVLSELIYT